MVQGFAHAALYTSRLEKTVRFYEEVFGGENLGFFTASAAGCWMKLGEGILEIFQGEDLGDGCLKHIALACDDVDTLYSRALAHGGQEQVAPKEISLNLKTPVKARIAFVRGINGEQIELFCQHESADGSL